MRLVSVALFATLVGFVTPASAEPLPKPRVVREPPAALALVVGAVTAIVPFAIGGTLMATGGDQTTRNVGAMITEGGFALAPITAHGVVSEWGRGLAFAALPIAGTGAMGTLIGIRPDAVEGGALGTNYAFVIILLGTIMTSTVGVVDVLFAPERAKDHLRLTPVVGRGVVGLGLGGDL